MPNLEYVVNLKASDPLGNHHTTTSSMVLSPTADAAVTVTAAPSSSALVAEVFVQLCKEVTEPIRYFWTLNGEPVAQDGKLLILRELMPGSYNVTCTVLLYRTNRILGTVSFETEISQSILDFNKLSTPEMKNNSIRQLTNNPTAKLCRVSRRLRF